MDTSSEAVPLHRRIVYKCSVGFHDVAHPRVSFSPGRAMRTRCEPSIIRVVSKTWMQVPSGSVPTI